ncbi:IS66 family insertion sequence element accessory protein TnpA [Thiospirochaeta perfilievii]|uniref:IS66 family insertion sequence element accessory protein TnpA n=1 Tax=Thiospirochaeta perfilievii TaxID=252967 RepID=UPI003CCC4F6A
MRNGGKNEERQTRDWKELIVEQENSGKSIDIFCNEKGIHNTAFYKNRKKLQKTNFVEIKENTKSSPVSNIESPIILSYGEFTIHLTTGF